MRSEVRKCNGQEVCLLLFEPDLPVHTPWCQFFVACNFAFVGILELTDCLVKWLNGRYFLAFDKIIFLTIDQLTFKLSFCLLLWLLEHIKSQNAVLLIFFYPVPAEVVCFRH